VHEIAPAPIDHDRWSTDQLEFEAETVCDRPHQVERRVDWADLDAGQM
jgi:hypothetical protein